MSDDPKNILDGLGDADWDSALDEWEKGAFEPAIAEDQTRTKAQDEAATSLPPDVAAPPGAERSEASEAPAAGSLQQGGRRPSAGSVPIARTSEAGLSTRKPEGTLIAPVPRELRDERGRVAPPAVREPSIGIGPRRASAPPAVAGPLPPAPSSRPSAPPSARGGLNQLFSRPPATSSRPIVVAPPVVAPPARRSEAPAPPVAPRVQDAAASSASITREVSPADARSLATGGAPATTNEPAPTRELATSALDRDEQDARGAYDSYEDVLEDPQGVELVPAENPTFEHPAAVLAPRAPTGRPRDDDDPPESETMVKDRKSVDEPRPTADATDRFPADDEMPTIGRPSNPPPSFDPSQPLDLSPDGAFSAEGAETTFWQGSPSTRPREERRESLLDETRTRAYEARIAWLEEEARITEDPTARARALLTMSELCAISGDRDRALALAIEARELEPREVPLAWRQTRQLMAWDPESVVAALDAEAHESPTPSARAHATLLAADVLRINALGDDAVERWDSACKLDPADPRAPIARAALALAQGDHGNAALRLADNSELIPLDRAVATALRLRGVERPGVEVDEAPINDGLRHARAALASGDVVATAQALVAMAAVPDVAKAALWLSAAFGATHIASRRAAARSLKTLAADGDVLARRQLAARGVELGDPELVSTALQLRDVTTGGTQPMAPQQDGERDGEPSARREGAFDAAERVLLPLLAAAGKTDLADLATSALALGTDRALAPLADAVLALAPIPWRDDDARDVQARAEATAGTPEDRALATLGRLAASGASGAAIDGALRAIERRTPSAHGVAVEAAVRGERWDDLADALSNLPEREEADAGGRQARQRHIAAAIIAERAGSAERAKAAWAAAARGMGRGGDGASDAGGVEDEGPPRDSLVRIAADVDPSVDLASELLRIADEIDQASPAKRTEGDGVASATLRLEALARAERDEARRAELDDGLRAELLEEVHRAAPQLGIGAFLAERIGRRSGDLDEVLRWIQERRSYANGPLETALDAVREALLVADRDPELASTRLEEAHRARPDDVALRELYERVAQEPPPDRGAWREARAARVSASATTGASAAALPWIEAALEHERARPADVEATLRAARRAAEAGDRGLSRPIIERCEVATGDTTRQTDELLEVTKTTEDAVEMREAFERLADLDAFGKKDLGAAMLWHRSILEVSPRHLPSLRWLEHALVTEGRDDELAPVFEQIAIALDGTGGGEVTGHAQHAARLEVREAIASGSEQERSSPSAWERTHDMARLAATQPAPSLWALRALNAHARVQKDEPAILDTTRRLLERTQRAPERATLLLRASESAARLDRFEEARQLLEQAVAEDPGDVVTWGFVAELRERTGDARLAAEACESLARTSAVPEHQLLAWHDAAKLWQELSDPDRALGALEACAEIDVTYEDVFPRLSAIYAEKRLDSELASLLEKRLATVEDEEERVLLEVELARTFADMGELSKAKTSLARALEQRPDHTTALAAMAELCSKEGDWTGAEQAYVRLARLLSDPAEQRVVYEKLGELYSVHAPNLSRAELAFKEVLKRVESSATRERGQDSVAVQAKLVDVYRRQGDVQKAAQAQQEIVGAATDPNARLAALIELAKIHETVGRDPRRSEQVLDSARKEFPTSVVALRAMAEFYARQRQMPAMQILLDRAAGDARRAFAQGRFVPSLFEVLHAAFELRNKRDAAKVVAATLAAVQGRESELLGGEARAVDPQLDDLLAPEAMSPPLRALLFRAGDALDAAAPVDLRAVRAAPLAPGTPIGATVGSIATVVGLGALQILVSPTLGRIAVPLATNPPTLLVGEGLARVTNERARMFVVVRAMKMIMGHMSALLRGTHEDVASVIAALLSAFNPGYTPQNVDARRVSDLARRIGPALGRNVDPTMGVVALEAAGFIGVQWGALAPAAAAWANRVALLAVGDPNAALDAIAWGVGEDAAPHGAEERAAWIARHAEARELMTFSVTDAYAEARMRLGLDR